MTFTLDNDILFRIVEIYLNNIKKHHILDSECLYKKQICKLLRSVNINLKHVDVYNFCFD